MFRVVAATPFYAVYTADDDVDVISINTANVDAYCVGSREAMAEIMEEVREVLCLEECERARLKIIEFKDLKAYNKYVQLVVESDPEDHATKPLQVPADALLDAADESAEDKTTVLIPRPTPTGQQVLPLKNPPKRKSGWREFNNSRKIGTAKLTTRGVRHR